MSLDEVPTIDAAGFAEKRHLLADPQDLDKFVDAGTRENPIINCPPTSLRRYPTNSVTLMLL